MYSWLSPFVVLAVVLLLYYFGGGNGKRETMKRDINFYMVCVMAAAIISIVASFRLEKDWLDMAAWVIGGVAACAALWRFKTTSVGVPDKSDTRGPLEKNDSRAGNQHRK